MGYISRVNFQISKGTMKKCVLSILTIKISQLSDCQLSRFSIFILIITTFNISRSHVYRRGPWKLILGQHGIPLAEVEVFREPVNWIAEDGNICDTFVEMSLW